MQNDSSEQELLSRVKKIMGVADNKQSLYDIHSKLADERKEQEQKYHGYFTESAEKNIIGILSSSDESTIIHEMGHLFLSGLNEFAQFDEESKKQLDVVNNWLGANGKEYTVAQAEKFARSFEAYLYKGKAPNNTLRGVFNKFKEWMRSIYTHISQIPDADLSFEAQQVFDRIFSGEEYYEKVKAINELSKKVRYTKLSNKFTDMEKRHRRAAYEVVSAATGYDISFVQRVLGSNSSSKRIQKLQEKILSAIEKVDDKLTVQGYHDEWLEFGYSLADVNDSTGDYAVAQKAYEDLITGTFMTEEIDQYGNMNEEDVQYKVLLKEYKKNKSNRDVVLGAFYDWIDSLKNSTAKEFYTEKFENDVAYQERFEKLDKFEQAKITILNKARELKDYGKGSEFEDYKELVIETMKNLNFLTPEDKARMTTSILDIPSAQFLETSLDNILDVAKTLDDKVYRNRLISLIRKELQSTKNIKRGAKTVGKYDYLTNKVFEELRELDKLTVEQANEKRLAIIYISKTDGTVSLIGGGYYSSNAWKWRVSGSTGIVLKPNTRYSFDFRVVPNSSGAPQSWNLKVTNLADGSVQSWEKATTYYPYNYRKKCGMTTIACNANVTAYAGGVLDLSTMIIKGQTSTYRPILTNDEIVFQPVQNTVVLPRINNSGDVHTYVVLNGVKTVNSTYDVDLSEYAKTKDVYSKVEIDNKGFVTDVPDFNIFATKEQLDELDSRVDDCALKSEIPHDLEELTNNCGYVLADEVVDIVNKIIPAEDIEKIKNITSYDDTAIKLDIEYLQSQVELLMSSKAEGDEVNTLTERVDDFQKAEDDEITEIANTLSNINIVEFND